MTSNFVIVVGTIIFLLTWILMAFTIRVLPIGRVLGTMLGAVAMIVTRILEPEEAIKSISIDTLCLLFGTMVMTIVLQREHFFTYVTKLLSYRCTSAYSLMARICIISGTLAAAVTNDTVCVFLTPVVVELCERHDLAHGPFLIALATSANIGSTLTPTGNPQNMLIASMSGITYGQFLKHISLATIICLALNIALLCFMYKEHLEGVSIRTSNAIFVRSDEYDVDNQFSPVELGEEYQLEEGVGEDTVGESEVHEQLGGGTVGDADADADGDGVPMESHHAADVDQLTVQQINIPISTSDSSISIPIEISAIPSSSSSTVSTVPKSTSSSSSNGASASSIPIDITDPVQVATYIRTLQLEAYSNSSQSQSQSQSTSVNESTQTKIIRVATSKQPRMKGRRLIMLPPNLAQLDSTSNAAASPLLIPFVTSNPLLSTVVRYAHQKLSWFLLILLGTVIAFIAGAPLGWASVTGAALMLLVDLKEPDEVLREVDWPLLVFFSSLFIVVKGFQQTGLPEDMWKIAQHGINMNTLGGITLYTILILLGSNTVSNVPLVLLFGPSIPTLADPLAAWLLLSFVSTVAGNLTLVGSVANLIVAARAKHFYRLEFIEYAKFGTPSTIIITIIGVGLVRALV